MKCRARVKGKRKPIIAPLYFWGRKAFKELTGISESNYITCDGKIIVSIMAEAEPYYGGTSPVLEVTYKCNKCGNDVFPELPNRWEIGEFVTRLLADTPEEVRDKLLEIRREQIGRS